VQVAAVDYIFRPRGLGFPTRFLPKPKNPEFFQNRKTGFTEKPVFGCL